MTIKISLPEYHQLLKDVPREDYPEKMEDFYSSLAYEAFNLIRYAEDAIEPQIVFNEMRKADDQYIWEFFVNDLSVPKANEYNWHGQNTSQWKYAGCILLQHNRISTHH